MKSIYQKLMETENNLNDNFWKWFGDSKVIDSTGNPLVVYHGSDVEFGVFKESNNGSWFISDMEEAREYGNIVNSYYIKILNPYIGTHEENAKYGMNKICNKARLSGKDGIIILADNEFYEENIYYEAQFNVYVVFQPTQIKSINNQGTWNPRDPNIYK